MDLRGQRGDSKGHNKAPFGGGGQKLMYENSNTLGILEGLQALQITHQL